RVLAATVAAVVAATRRTGRLRQRNAEEAAEKFRHVAVVHTRWQAAAGTAVRHARGGANVDDSRTDLVDQISEVGQIGGGSRRRRMRRQRQTRHYQRGRE